MNHDEAQQIARAINIIRPDWPTKSTTSVLAEQKHRPARDVHLALTWCAYDPDTKTPARINADGPWWHTARLAGVATEPTPSPAAYLTCPMHGQPEPCRDCPPPANPATVTQAIAAAKAAIRQPKEQQ